MKFRNPPILTRPKKCMGYRTNLALVCPCFVKQGDGLRKKINPLYFFPMPVHPWSFQLYIVYYGKRIKSSDYRTDVLLRFLPLSGSITPSPSSLVEGRGAGFPFCPLWLASWLFDSSACGWKDESPPCTVLRERCSRSLSGIWKKLYGS